MIKVLFFLIFIFFVLGHTYSRQKIVYFYFQNQFMVLYAQEENKLFVDFNSGFVIKPEDQEKKIKFVEYLLDVQSFISRDEDVFTKIYVLKKTINFDFSEVEPTNIDYYSWGPLTYKYLAVFCKGVNESITIRIPSFEQLTEEDKREIIDRYRLVFGTTFNEPRYSPYDITFKNLGFQARNNITQEVHTSEMIYNSETMHNTEATQNIGFTTTTLALNTTTMNFTVVPTTSHLPESSVVSWNNLVYYIFPPLIGIIILGLFLLRKQRSGKSNGYRYMKSNEIIQISEQEKNVSSIQRELEELKQRNELIEKRLNELFQKVSEISDKTEIMYKKYEEKEMKGEEISNVSVQDSYEIINESEGDMGVKPLDRENLEMIMFKIDSLVNKFKLLERYKEMDIGSRANKVALELYEFKAKVRKNKSINLSEWDMIVKNLIIELISTLDKYNKKFGDNENIKRVRKEIMEECEIEELHIVPEKTKVNIMDHRVEGYSRNPNLQNGVIVEVKEEGYKYKGITVKRAKVIENRI